MTNADHPPCLVVPISQQLQRKQNAFGKGSNCFCNCCPRNHFTACLMPPSSITAAVSRKPNTYQIMSIPPFGFPFSYNPAPCGKTCWVTAPSAFALQLPSFRRAAIAIRLHQTPPAEWAYVPCKRRLPLGADSSAASSGLLSESSGC